MYHRRMIGHSGNSITITLPRDLLTQVGLWAGDRVELCRYGRNSILINPPGSSRNLKTRKPPKSSSH
jgi:antitoxin component of MazEF toxin-antitoxin module